MLSGEMQAYGPGICHSHRRGPQEAGLGQQQQDLVPVLWGLPSQVALATQGWKALVRWLCRRCHGGVFSGRGQKAHDCNLLSSSLAVPPWREEVEAGGTEPRATGSQARLASGPQWVLGRARRGAVMFPAEVSIWGPETHCVGEPQQSWGGTVRRQSSPLTLAPACLLPGARNVHGAIA